MIHQKNTATKYNRYPEIFDLCKSIKGDEKLNILSFGCSTGDEIQTLKDIYFKNSFVDGVDINPECISLCIDKFGKDSIYEYNEFINSKKTYDVIFAMSVLCKWEDSISHKDCTKLVDDCSEIYPFEKFNFVTKLLSEKLNEGGILVIYNSNFCFQDASCYDDFIPILYNISDSGFVHKFNKFNKKISVNYNDIIFEKKRKYAYLFGTGGSGVTYLKRKLGWTNKEPTSHQHFRYINKPYMGINLDIPKGAKIVYLYTHPFNILLSFERRGFMEDIGAVCNLQADHESYLKINNKNITGYLKNGVDCFMFGNHFQSFYEQHDNDVLFVKYESLKDNINYISDWAGVSIDSDELLNERNCQYEKLDQNTLISLSKIHGGWADHYNKLPNLFTNRPYKKEYEYLKKHDYTTKQNNNMEILERFKEIISNSHNPFVLEFGACDAYHSRIMLDILQESKKPFNYHLFEPNQDLIINVANKIQYYLTTYGDKVRFFNEAIGAENGKMKFYKSGGTKVEDGKVVDNYYGSSSIRKPKLVTEIWKDMTFTELQCDVITLDYHIKRSGIENERIVDFIWADIQGAEVDLIKGGTETFKRVKYFYTEYANSEYYEGEIGLPEICAMLPDFEIIEDYGGDVLLKNKNL
jgi:FkbM family methyltransferase